MRGLNGKVETSASELLSWSILSSYGLAFHSVSLSFFLHFSSLLLLEVSSLRVLNFFGQSFNFIFIFISLSLIHVKFSCHSFHCSCFFLQTLLIDRKLFCNLRSGLSCKNVLQLGVKLFLFLYNDIFLYYFFSLFYQSLLKGLNLQNHFPGIWVSSFKFSPSMIVDWIFKLF